jgi:hypothetical protein
MLRGASAVEKNVNKRMPGGVYFYNIIHEGEDKVTNLWKICTLLKDVS